MNLKEKMKKFNKRWSVTTEESESEAFDKFKKRILNIFKDINSKLDRESISEFCQYYGIEEVWKGGAYGGNAYNVNVISKIISENEPIEFFRLLEVIFALNIQTYSSQYGSKAYSKNTLFYDTKKAIEYSTVDVRIVNYDGDVAFYPAGETNLDDELVEYPLSFLGNSSGEHFIDALKFYEAGQHIKSAESLRRSLEEYLREKLENKKGLKENIQKVKSHLKNNKVSIKSMVSSNLNLLDVYFNDNSKHNDGDIKELDNEFLIYQMGLLMRYIERLYNKE